MKMSHVWKQMGRTVRVALKGWPHTLRLISLMAAATVIWLVIGGMR